MTSKRAQAIEAFNSEKSSHNSTSGIDLLKKFTEDNGAKFEESFDVSVVLGIDPRKMNVRGSVVPPNSTGKSINICCFVEDGEDTTEILKNGANAAGSEDMINDIIEGKIACDVLLTVKGQMPKLGKFGRQLGGKGLMPNPKDDTIAGDIAELIIKVQESSKGKLKFRNDKAGIVHASIGKAKMDTAQLVENIKALIQVIRKLKPVKAKGKYLKKIYLSSTMGPAIQIESAEFE